MVTNYGYSGTGKLNSVYFGPQMAKNRTRVFTHPTGGHQAGHAMHLLFFVVATLHGLLLVIACGFLVVAAVAISSFIA